MAVGSEVDLFRTHSLTFHIITNDHLASLNRLSIGVFVSFFSLVRRNASEEGVVRLRLDVRVVFQAQESNYNGVRVPEINLIGAH